MHSQEEAEIIGLEKLRAFLQMPAPRDVDQFKENLPPQETGRLPRAMAVCLALFSISCFVFGLCVIFWGGSLLGSEGSRGGSPLLSGICMVVGAAMPGLWALMLWQRNAVRGIELLRHCEALDATVESVGVSVSDADGIGTKGIIRIKLKSNSENLSREPVDIRGYTLRTLRSGVLSVRAGDNVTVLYLKAYPDSSVLLEHSGILPQLWFLRSPSGKAIPPIGGHFVLLWMAAILGLIVPFTISFPAVLGSAWILWSVIPALTGAVLGFAIGYMWTADPGRTKRAGQPDPLPLSANFRIKQALGHALSGAMAATAFAFVANAVLDTSAAQRHSGKIVRILQAHPKGEEAEIQLRKNDPPFHGRYVGRVPEH